ncbi:MAG: cell division protein ZapD [Gammaproteobacteria bacterium]
MSDEKSLVFYEQPLNERVRSFLRLDFLFRQAAHTLGGESRWDSRATLGSIIDILEVLARTDLKTELLKELERHQTVLARLRRSAAVDQERLESILERLAGYQEQLHADMRALGQDLKDHEFLASIRQRATVPGGSCDFDLPSYHHWLQQPPQLREAELRTWLDTLEGVRAPVELLVRLIRESSNPTEETAEAGFFQRSLDPSGGFQLIRVGLPPDAPYFAEISAGKHRFTVRFLEPQGADRPRPVAEGIPFRLCCCAI